MGIGKLCIFNWSWSDPEGNGKKGKHVRLKVANRIQNTVLYSFLHLPLNAVVLVNVLIFRPIWINAHCFQYPHLFGNIFIVMPDYSRDSRCHPYFDEKYLFCHFQLSLLCHLHLHTKETKAL